MKKALDCVGDYQLESACKDAPCIASSRVTARNVSRGLSSRPWSFCSVCKNLRRQHPLEAKIWFSEKVDLGESESIHGVVSGPKFTGFIFAERGRNHCRSHVLQILDISVRFGDIRDRSLKLSEVDPRSARFWPQLFLGTATNILGPRL